MSTGGDSSGSTFAYAAPFPDSPYPNERDLERYRKLFEPPVAPAVPFLGPAPLNEEGVRRIIREELERYEEVGREKLDLLAAVSKPIEQVMCELGDAHLLEIHPMEDPAGAD